MLWELKHQNSLTQSKIARIKIQLKGIKHVNKSSNKEENWRERERVITFFFFFFFFIGTTWNKWERDANKVKDNL